MVVVCAGHIACGMSSPETGSITSHRFSTTKEAEPPERFADSQASFEERYAWVANTNRWGGGVKGSRTREDCM